MELCSSVISSHFLSAAMYVGSFLFAALLLRRIQRAVTSNIVTGMQGLVDKMKEYDLDARAGLLICSGADLRIRYMDSSLEQLLGSPKCVDDILVPSMRARHRQIVARYVGDQPLPDSLNHPLRNVPILTKQSSVISAKVIIGKIHFFSQFVLPDIFYVVVQPCENLMPTKCKSSPIPSSFSNLSAASTEAQRSDCDSSNASGSLTDSCSDFTSSASGGSDASSSSECQSLAEVYGLGVASYLGRGLVPATLRYNKATVLYVDIVDFTRHCMEKGLDEISGWMSRIHTTIDELLERHAIRKVETRGDCCICVSGTNFVGNEHGSSRDLSATQATRMLTFGHDLGLALSAIEGTQVRMGMATGSVVLTHIAHGGDTLPAKYIYGDTVNVACRMEQTGRVGAVQLTEAAARAYAEENMVAVPPLRARQVKGKGEMLSTFYDYARGAFVPPADPAPSR